jgi:putative transposase
MGWNLSALLDTRSSLDAFQMALLSAYPEIINSDQGCQYTSEEWTTEMLENKIQISMDGKGRWADNIFIERFWRSLKYENLYLHSFETIAETRKSFGNYIVFYNQRRPHQSLNYKTPDCIYNEYKNIIQKREVANLNFFSENKPAVGLTIGGA